MTPSDSPTGAPTPTDKQVETDLDRFSLTDAEIEDALWDEPTGAPQAALSAQAPPGEPVYRCSRCNRATWDRGSWNARCLMTQPDGSQCDGRFAGTPQAAIGAPPPALVTDEQIVTMAKGYFEVPPPLMRNLIRFAHALLDHPAQAVASSPTPSLGHQTESDSSRPEAVDGDRAGWRFVRVNAGFEGLMRALQRAHDKGYMPDAITDDYEGFDYEL